MVLGVFFLRGHFVEGDILSKWTFSLRGRFSHFPANLYKLFDLRMHSIRSNKAYLLAGSVRLKFSDSQTPSRVSLRVMTKPVSTTEPMSVNK